MSFLGTKEQFELTIAKLHASEGILSAIGVSALLVGILVDVFVLRLFCLVVVIASVGLIYAGMRARHLNIQTGLRSAGSLFHSQHESEIMKKLIFDDFHFHSKGGFRIEDIHRDRASVENEAAAVRFPADQKVSVARRPASPVKSVHAPLIREFQVSDFFDVDSDIYKGDAEPRTEFDFLLNKVLGVIKEVLFAHTVAFFWANREKQQMVLEARVTDSPNFIASRRFAIGHDLVSKVAQTGKPEFVTEVNPVSEQELLPYYSVGESVKSFIGVPVFFSRGSQDATVEQPVAVIAVDGKAEDEFGRETLQLLGQFTKLISALIKSYNDKYDLLIDSELLNSIRRLQERIRNTFSMDTIVQSLGEETSKLINWDFLSIVLYEETKHSWVVKKVTNRSNHGYILSEQAIDFPDSIVGKTIRNNTHFLVDDVAVVTTPRYYMAEKLESSGSFLSVPISSLNKCYGAVSIESREKFNFSRQDIEMLYRLAENVASALEIFYMQEVINEYVIIDGSTGVYSKKFFAQRMAEELQRADDAADDLALLFIMADKSTEILERYGKDGYERVMLTLSKAIRASIRPYDIVGRYDENRFGALLLDTAANDAYLWAEKIRKNIAGIIINLDGKSFSITISIGVCGALEGMKKEELLCNTITVLNRASEAGGNVVRVY